MHSEPGALLFDFDGVLADTEPLYWRAWSSVLALHDVPLSWDDYCRIGRGIKDEQMLKSLPQLASDPPLLARVKQRMGERKELVRQWWSEELPISPSTVDLLKSLGGFRLGLVTSSDRCDVEPLLCRADIKSCFHAIVFGEDTHHHKPDPEPYLVIRERLGVETGTAFEDSDAGLQSATSAGFQAIRVHDPRQLPAIVAKMLGRTGESLA
jgi:beta-phosphoglucomutase